MEIRFEESDGVKKYIVNGKTYTRIEDIPSEYQSYFEDKNNNGIPEQFEGLMRPDFFKNAVKKASGDLAGSRAKSSKVTNPIVQEERSFIPTLLKITVAIFIGVMAWFYFKNVKKEDGVQTYDSLASGSISKADQGETPTENSNTIESETEPIILRVEDPNEPPYHMFVSASLAGKQLFAIDVPDGEVTTPSDDHVLVKMPEKKETNLRNETFAISVTSGGCILSQDIEDQIRWEKQRIGDRDFNKGSGGSISGPHIYTNSFYYSFEVENQCVTFILKIETVSDQSLGEVDQTKEVEKIEALLKSIRFK